ncbi:MAG: ABC transporter ATP-binding protein [Verrucomicrobiota bacterium]
MRITLQHLQKNFGATRVLRDIDLEIGAGELFFLLGPSGCGKTTLLRLIAGFYPPDAGEIRFGERRMNAVPPHRRNTGMVFQNYALWPHLDVAANVAYGLDVRGVTRAEKEERVRRALALVRMEDYAARSPNQLSGGQQQRVALARALVIQPDVLLLDEPLSNLDARLRLEMRDEIRRLHREIGLTTVYVTHDQKEALSLATRMAVMRDGQVAQLADPRTVYRRPAGKFVADFVGESNWWEGRVAAATDGRVTVDGPLGPWRGENFAGVQVGQTVWVGFRPEAAALGTDPVNRLAARLVETNYLGEIEEYLLERDGRRFKVFVQNPERALAPGTTLSLNVRPSDLLVLPREGSCADR